MMFNVKPICQYVMRITSLIAFLCDVLIVFSTNFWIFLGARVAVAAAISGCYVATFTYGIYLNSLQLELWGK